ncbi:hypothetical protein [Wolbachia endosymbiont of Ctenocephalides felis wCfeJ]|uniref:hypothetical protein n=1 Tax=Wolbachia endosymbiont of Ctenocephalides felis wCfeJ TaxID=2732594 RepID=UPI001448A202|nr:hypothetical protein [Wolbachia endosymbiont of Ctenocephalides felis wCfeJ]WCR57693.1 MAG: hypothetical protein PG980_000165 [Wolbachia endosymbiont of Ctenocephalides felis wCfeJ]
MPETRKDSSKLWDFQSEYRKIKNQKSVDMLDEVLRSLSKDMKTDKIKKAEKIKVAKKLLELDVSINVISRASSLSAKEFT